VAPIPFTRLFGTSGLRAVELIVPRRTFDDVLLPPATRRALDTALAEVADIIRQYGTRFIETQRAWVTAAPPCASRDRALPDRRLRRASRSLCRLRPSRHLVQLVSQSALPEVLDVRARP
jgi:hypothetical protein